MISLTINSFSLSLSGLVITYNSGTTTSTLNFDAKATCDLMERAGMIEGFDIDANGEPVIYYTEKIWNRPATAFCFWCDFVKTFPFIERHAEILVEYLIESRATRKAISKIDYLLYPLKATA